MPGRRATARGCGERALGRQFEHGEQALPERRSDEALHARQIGNQFLPERTGGGRLNGFKNAVVEPPAKETGDVDVAQLTDSEADAFSHVAERLLGIAAVMAKGHIEAAKQGRAGWYEQHYLATPGQNGGEVEESALIVLDASQSIDAEYGVRMVARTAEFPIRFSAC